MGESGVRQAVVLAAGAGKRMRRPPEDGTALLSAQEEMARRGLKGLIPILGRPFLDHVLEALVEAGIERVCLVVSQRGGLLESRYRDRAVADLEISFALQAVPRGTADALLASEDFARGERFLLLNSDNYYSSRDLSRLARTPGAAVLALDCRAVLEDELTNIDRGRLESYAFLEIGPSEHLVQIVEKPGATLWSRSAEPLVGVNAWQFDSAIFASCRAVTPSARDELELPAAVEREIEVNGAGYRVLKMRDPMLDLSSRADVGEVERLLPMVLERGRALG